MEKIYTVAEKFHILYVLRSEGVYRYAERAKTEKVNGIQIKRRKTEFSNLRTKGYNKEQKEERINSIHSSFFHSRFYPKAPFF